MTVTTENFKFFLFDFSYCLLCHKTRSFETVIQASTDKNHRRTHKTQHTASARHHKTAGKCKHRDGKTLTALSKAKAKARAAFRFPTFPSRDDSITSKRVIKSGLWASCNLVNSNLLNLDYERQFSLPRHQLRRCCRARLINFHVSHCR